MEIKTAKYLVSSPNFDLCPVADRPEFAFIGRSNVGKSSLINMLTNNSKLAKVSSSPGKTTLINHFIINESQPPSWYLVDLPGYGYAKRSITQRKEWEKMLEGYFQNRDNLQLVFVLIDSRIEPQKIDLEFLRKLSAYNVPFALIFTKTDKVNQSISSKNINAFVTEMKKEWHYIPAKFQSSAVKGSGRTKILSFIGEEIEKAYSEDA